MEPEGGRSAVEVEYSDIVKVRQECSERGHRGARSNLESSPQTVAIPGSEGRDLRAEREERRESADMHRHMTSREQIRYGVHADGAERGKRRREIGPWVR